jgi:phage-related protein
VTGKRLRWLGSSRKDLKQFPPDVQDEMGFALWLAQTGDKHPDANPLTGFGGASVLEIVDDHDSDT